MNALDLGDQGMAGANNFRGTARAENAESIDATRDRPITIMVVDDSAVIRGLFTRILENEPDFKVVTSAANGRLAVQELPEQHVDIIVLELDMPVMDGLTALPILLESSSNTKVIIASTLSTPSADLTMKALAAGASDYIPKPSARHDIARGAPTTERRSGVTWSRRFATSLVILSVLERVRPEEACPIAEARPPWFSRRGLCRRSSPKSWLSGLRQAVQKRSFGC